MSLIDGFVKATEGLPCPENYRLWAGYTLVSTLMSRRVWTETISGSPLYGNLFTILVGKPGSGKTYAIEAARTVLKPYRQYMALSPNAVSWERMCQQLAMCFPDPDSPLALDENDPNRAYGIYVEEITSFMPDVHLTQMQSLASLWSCQADDWNKETKTQGYDNLHDPYVTMLGGAQPGWFQDVLGNRGLRLGFISRLMFCYSDARVRPVYFSEDNNYKRQIEAYTPLVRPVTDVRGYIPFSPEAKEHFLDWVAREEPGQNNLAVDWYGTTEDYATRRAQHLAKLALVRAVATHPALRVIEQADLERAQNDLWQIETDIPTVMSFVSGNPFKPHQLEVLARIKSYCGKANPPLRVPEATVRRYLGEQIPSTMVSIILDEMCANQQLRSAEPERLKPNRVFLPGPAA